MIRVLLLLLFAVAAQAAGPYRVTVVANADGTIRTAYPAGDFTPAATLSADCTNAPLLTPLETGTAFSHNYRQFFSGSAAAAATLSVVTVSGDTAATYNWSISTDNLVNTGAAGNAGHSGILKVRATNGASVADCPNQSWAWVAPPVASDTVAPPPVTGFRATGTTDVNEVELTWDACRDPYNNANAEPGSGCSLYSIKLNGSVVDTLAAAVGLNSTLTPNTIGLTAASPTCTQTGNSWAMSVGGVGFAQGAADGMIGCLSSFTGDGHAIARVPDLSAETSFPKAGVMVRESTAAGAKMCGLYRQGATTVQMRCRQTTSGTAATVAEATIASIDDPSLKLELIGTALAGSYSLDGGLWIALGSITWTPTTNYWGIGASSTDSSDPYTVITATIDRVNVNNVGPVTHTVNEPCTAPCLWTINNQDATPSASAYTTHTVSAVPEAPAAGEAIKWHPGHYMDISGLGFSSSWMTSFNSQVDSICANSNIKGVQLTKTWASLEGPTLGAYSTGFGYMDQVMTKLASCNKRLILRIAERSFGSASVGTPTVNWFSWLYPDYVRTDSAYGGTAAPYGITLPPEGTTFGGGLTSIARMWNAQIMDRLIAVSQAYGARYNSSSNFEMLSIEETSFSLPTGQDGYSASSWDTQFRRWYSASSVAWPNTQVRISANYYAADMNSLFTFCVTLGNCNVGGPDPELPLPTITRTITANRVFRGLDGGTDRRGVIPWVGEQQDLGMTTRYFETPNEIQTYQNDTMNASYMIWRNNACWSSTCNGGASVLQNLINTSYAVGQSSCPSGFASCNTN